jgi:hypothetical protein
VAARLGATTEWVTRGDDRDYPWEFTASVTVAGVPVEVCDLYSQQEYDALCAVQFKAVG